ncbi:MAG: hypothetical protein RLZZ455_762 [Candidatus Parcubacteria bacterium]|jgi:hypothetical protein
MAMQKAQRERDGINTLDLFEPKEGYEPLILTEEHELFITSLQAKTEEKLAEIGIPNPHLLTPNRDEIDIRRSRDKKTKDVSGMCGTFRTYLKLNLPQGIDITDPRAQNVYFHEAGHFVQQTILRRDPLDPNPELTDDNVILHSSGFQNDYLGLAHRGAFEEPMAVMFSQFCMDEGFTEPLVYAHVVAFMQLFLLEYAKRADISPLQAFKNAFAADATRDFSFQRELVGHFGKDAIRTMNRTVATAGFYFTTDYLTVAEYGGFRGEYEESLQRLKDGEILVYPGIPGGIQAIENPLFF